MVWVRPGVLLVLAILLPTSELIRLDLPTFERPTKAISGAPEGGNCPGSAADITKRVRTFMPYYRRREQKVQVKPPDVEPSFGEAQSMAVQTTTSVLRRGQIAAGWSTVSAVH